MLFQSTETDIIAIISLVVLITFIFILGIVMLKLFVLKSTKKNKNIIKKASTSKTNENDFSTEVKISFDNALSKSLFYSRKNVLRNDIMLWQNVKINLENKEHHFEYLLRTKKTITIFEVKESRGYDDIGNTQVYQQAHYTKKHKQQFVESCNTLVSSFKNELKIEDSVKITLVVIFTNKLVDFTGLAAIAPDYVKIYKPIDDNELLTELNKFYTVSVNHDISSNAKDLILSFDHELKKKADSMEVTKIIEKKNKK